LFNYLGVFGLFVAFANICIIVVLLSIYWKNYRKWKSEYTIGLLVFGTFLLVQNLLSLGFLAPPQPPHPLPQMHNNGNELSLLLINVSQLVALLALLKISWK
jgi:hypothetical protein